MMTITTKDAERFARWCDTDGFTERAAALRSLAAERDALKGENARLWGALKDLLTPQTPASFAGAMVRARAALGEKE
jgi:hypothetical protein